MIKKETFLIVVATAKQNHVDRIKMQRNFFLVLVTIHGLHNQQPTLFPKHPTTMISQRAVVLSALVALFALLSAADAQQLRANNKRVLIEQEVSSFKSNPSAVFVQSGGRMMC